MRLLVSVRDVCEAVDALAGGADVIDVKDPALGALGVADVDTARAIARRVGARRPVSIVIGDLSDPRRAAHTARRAAMAGASMVKLGVAGVESPIRAREVMRAAASGASSARTAIVAYGDAYRARALEAEKILEIALLAGVRGIVLDTFDKKGPTLLAQMSPARLAGLIRTAHDAGLFVGLAGRLDHEHLGTARELGVDLFGVRGAECTAGRAARLSMARVGRLALLLREHGGTQLTVQSA